MEDLKDTIGLNTKESSDAADDSDIVYTFVVPKGEIYQDPDESDNDPVSDKRDVQETLVYAAKDLHDDEDIVYTFVVPKGEIYREPDPAATIVAEKLLSADTPAADDEGRGDNDDTSKDHEENGEDEENVNKTRYGLPENHPGMGELAQKQEERRLYKEHKRNRSRVRFYVTATVLIAAIGCLILSLSGIFTIDAIEVQGNSHYTAEEIINMGHASPGRNIIYKANIKEITEYLEQNPYIKEAEVKRRLPSTLVIKVEERDERLAFRYDDDYLIMDDDGILLKKTRNKPQTTVLEGIVVSKIRLGEKIGTEDTKRLDRALNLIKMMIKSDLYFVKLDMSNDKKVYAYIYDTLVVKTDYDTLMTNMKNGRLHLVVEKLFADGIERGTIGFEDDGSASFMPLF